MRVFLTLVAILELTLAAVPATAEPLQASPVAGVVVDQSGAVVAGATVVVAVPGTAGVRTTTGFDGRFSAEAPDGVTVDIIVRLTGFVESRQSLVAGAPRGDVRITMRAAAVTEALTVTATRSEQVLGVVPASVSILDRAELQRSPGVVADDVLRRLPAFSLFRRTSSIASHPTAQGVSLRGLGPSGVSRTLVLLDGVPFNDPFGGWVHWTRVPLEAADRVEVVDGSSSSLYGNYAMGGVINIVTRPALPRSVEFRTQYGSWNSPKLDLRASDVWGRWSATVDVSSFATDGYVPVAPGERGPVDVEAGVEYSNVSGRLQYEANDNVQVFVQGGYFSEDRDNGKVSTINGEPEANSTRWTSASTGLRARLTGGDDIQVRVFVDDETFRSNFLAVTNPTGSRSAGRMSLAQRVPTTSVGALTQWSRAFGSRHAVSAGFDWRRVTGESQEQVLDFVRGEVPVTLRNSGGRQQSMGLYVQDVVAVTEALTLTLSGRVDHWRNDDGHNLEVSASTGQPTANHMPNLPDKSDTVGSPRIGVTYAINPTVSVWGSAGAGFRAPTLNELYRQFRVGSVITLANYELGPERLVGGEGGIRLAPSSNLNVRATWFDNRVTDPVSNVTISTGNLIIRQRQNLGQTRIRGLQADTEYRPSVNWRVTAAYLYSHATVRKFDADPDLVGKFLPQVPRHRATFAVTYTNPRVVDFSVDVQVVGSQFDDDRNEIAVPGYSSPGLPEYGLVSLSASRRISPVIDVFASVQNLFDQEYFVGTRPTTIGSPRMATVGVRVRVGRQ